MPRRTGLSPGAALFRAGHTLVAFAFLYAIGYVWWCALTGRRDRRLTIAMGALAAEGVVVGVNGGDCPLGRLQARLGDPVPLFELVLPRRAARLAVPALGLVAGGGAALVIARPPRALADELPLSP